MKVLKFAVISGMGLAIDMGVFTLLHALVGIATMWANLCSASAAVTFVFFAAAYRVFYDGADRFLLGKFGGYVVYQMAAISAASWLIQMLEFRLSISGLMAKVLVTPFTFYCNYLFMGWLLRPRVRETQAA